MKKQQQTVIYVRVPVELAEQLRKEALLNERSLTGQVVVILRERYAAPR